MVKSNLELTSRTQYLGMLIDTIRERVSSKDFRISVFCDVADKFLLHFPLLARMWQQILGYMAPMEQLISKARGGGGAAAAISGTVELCLLQTDVYGQFLHSRLLIVVKTHSPASP